MVAFYCISRDVLPFPLELPEAIAKATTHRQLEAISHMGQELLFTLHFVLIPFENNMHPLSLPQQLQLTNHSASNKRHRFKRSMRLRLSESSMNLSLEGVGSYSPPPSVEQPVGSERLQKDGTNPQRRVHAGSGIEVAALERRPAPSLAELDSSSSFSSMDEDSDSDSDPESMVLTQRRIYQRPPLVRSRGRGGLHRMSEAFVCFFAPDKRLTRLVEELSRDRRSIFGGMVQDFLLEQREVLKSLASSSPRVTSVQLLQGLRLFLSQAKCCLLDSGELEPPIETLTGVPDCREVERVRKKLVLMQRTHSPIDKVLLLLQVCKCVHKAMGCLHGEKMSWDDFLPSLSYVIVECNRPHVLIEVEYMMELLETSWLGGEGGYYLTSVYASLCLIQSLDRDQPFSGCLTAEAQEALKEWSCRRSREAQRQKESQQNQVGTKTLRRTTERLEASCVGLCCTQRSPVLCRTAGTLAFCQVMCVFFGHTMLRSSDG
uniref:Si:ch211-168d1.3 n=1 Tax=Echeneis naucrates TaxID=173247 RepID=A0A665U6B4_ECHNA